MENGPWYIAGRPIILRVWQPGMEMLNIQLKSMPIWVKFYNIPLEYWTNTCIGYIASVVGKPLHMDSLTENRSRLSFARICIKVDSSSQFPKTARLNLCPYVGGWLLFIRCFLFRTAPPLKQRRRGISLKQKTPNKQQPTTHIRAQPTQNKQAK